MSDAPTASKKTLELRQTWFLGLSALFVVLMFAFVILPYVDRKPAKLSGQQAPDFNLELLSGGDPGDRVRLSDLKGRIVVLDFWASWCMPCREQSQVLSAVSPKLDSDVYLLGVATTDQRPAAVAFLEEEKPPYPNAFDEGGELSGVLHVTELPTLVVLDENGVIKAAESRMLSAQEIVELIASVRDAS